MIMYNPERVNKITVVEAVPNDAKDIAEIQREGWLTTYVNEELGITKEAILAKDFGSENHVNRWKEGIAKPNTKTWIAREENKAVGFCFVKIGADTNHLGALYVLSKTRGSGVGSKLMEQALGFLGRKKPIELEVASYNRNAILFYERFGFKNMGEIVAPTSGALSSGLRSTNSRK